MCELWLIILDFTCGTGSTLVACVNTKRKFIGIEKNPAFCDTIVTRLTSQAVDGNMM